MYKTEDFPSPFARLRGGLNIGRTSFFFGSASLVLASLSPGQSGFWCNSKTGDHSQLGKFDGRRLCFYRISKELCGREPNHVLFAILLKTSLGC